MTRILLMYLFVGQSMGREDVVPESRRPSHVGAVLVDPASLPLRTSGRYIADTYGQRVKWSCINWYGAYSEGQMVVGGLEKQPMDFIVDRIVGMGFNCVRLSYSTQGFYTNPAILPEFVKMNPQFKGKTWRDVFDATVATLTQAGLMVIINNHVTMNTWCCLFAQDEGLWYNPEWPEEKWIGGLAGLAERYANNSLVVAYDLRNEPHDYKDTLLTWGGGDPKTDYAAAQERAGNAVLAKAPHVLIVVEAMCFAMDLRGVKQRPLQFSEPNRLVYQVHNYLDFQDFKIFSRVAMSYEDFENYAAWVAILTGFVLVFLLVGWGMVRFPRAPTGVLAIGVGVILSFFGLVGMIVVRILLPQIKQMKACSFTFHEDYAWLSAAVMALIIVGSLISVFGVLRVTHVIPSMPYDFLLDDTNDGGWCGEPGWKSASVFWQSFMNFFHAVCCGKGKKQGRNREIEMEVTQVVPQSQPNYAMLSNGEDEHAEWDRFVCLGWMLFVLFTILFLVSMGVYNSSGHYGSYDKLAEHLDMMWGFVLTEGHDYTAPVWLGEFGEVARGNYWLQLMRYMAERDLDFAFWPLNGNAYKNLAMNIEGGDFIGMLTGKMSASFTPIEPSAWFEESWGLLDSNYSSVRRPWLLKDLQALMDSPVKWRPDPYPCDRDVHSEGSRCGG